ncbi:hypothetical protein [Catenulispora pinisilvae]|uniref:hypothetical protein n=1 Tax=Catenulispora pinisilvae TaxID=2705253 RepID=UPI001890FD0B|nr:hypothetical protein [Catenulispora pinisilvae]
MAGIEWNEVPADVRARVDELVIADEWFGAVRELWENGREPRIGLNDCQDLVYRRQVELADRIRHKPEPPRDLPTLIAAVEALPRRPDAIEALWDGDSRGWMTLLLAVTSAPRTEAGLAQIRHGGDLRLFNGQVPPWPEAQEATELGTALARHFDLPFFFHSPDTPELPDVRWWDTL